MIKIGMTGSRRGMAKLQQEWWSAFIAEREPFELHHGDCVGADAIAHEIAYLAGCSIVIHPPSNPKLRAYCGVIDAGFQIDSRITIRDEKPYLDRNADIVKETEFLIAFPWRDIVYKGEGGGGTWSTIRYADREAKKKIIVVYGNGKTDILNG